MRLRRFCSLLLLVALLASTLASCGFAAPLMKRSVALSEYPVSAQAENVAISTNLGDIRVMSFNVQGTVSEDATLRENRYLAVLGQITDYNPTVFGLQEDSDHWNNYLSSQLKNYVRINDTPGTNESCSIYYDKTVLGTPVTTGMFWLTHTGQSGANALRWEDVPQRHRDALNMKSASDMRSNHAISCYIDGELYTEMDAVLDVRLMTYGIFELNGQKFLYVNTHIQHRSQNGKLAVNIPEFLDLREMERKAEWDILHKNVTSLLNQYGDMPVVITGDLNEVPGSPSYNHFDIYYENAAKLAKLRKGQDGSWNAAWNADNNGEMYSQNADERHQENQSSSTLDYCFISPNDFTVEQFQVADSSRYITNSKGESGYVMVSDHLAIVTDLSFGKDEDAPTVILQKPGFETSAISYYSGKPDVSWFDIDNLKSEYVLTTADQLIGFMFIRQDTTQTNYFFEGVTIKLGANMVFNQLKDGITDFTGSSDWKTSYGWKEVHSDYQFKGIFDGQGHYVSGLYMPYASSNKGMLGAIGGNAVVKNFALVDSYLRTPTTDAEDKTTIGSIAARVASGGNVTFYNLYSDCIMEETNKNRDFNVCGGLVGSVALSDASATFKYCTFAGSISIEGPKAGGILGQVNHSTAKVTISNCVNAAEINGSKYTGGLIGFAKAESLYITNCANIGDVTAGRCSGGLLGTVSQCPDLIVADCAVNANLDFSSIGEGGTAENPVSVPAGCQVGGLIGRIYATDGHISGISLSGSMKGAANIKTDLDKGTNSTITNYLASGAIIGFSSCYADDEAVKNGSSSSRVFPHLYCDTILVSMDMTDVGSYLGGTRDTPVNGKHAKLSYRDVIYDQEKYAASGAPTLWGARIDKDRMIDHSNEKNSQLTAPYAVSPVSLYTAEGLNAKTNVSGASINYTTSRAKFTTWQKVNGGVLVPTVALRDLIESAVKTDDLFVLGYQTKANAENAALTDYRFVSVMKDTGVPAIGYHVTISYLNAAGEKVKNEQTVYCPNVYTKIKGGNEVYEASKLGGDYLFTLVIEGVPATGKTANDITVTVQPFGAEKDGAEILFTDYRAMTYVLN